MKKLISLAVTIVLLLGMCFQMTIVNAAESELKALPQVGEVISGFKAMEVSDMELINSKTVLFEHEKTGAKLFYIQSRDIDRSFTISFKTPAVDDTGVNHILEHISVSGSEKYPLKNVLFTVANQTYSTFVNAMTSSAFTAYPVASMSEEQLLKLTDVYMDCVYNPSIYSNKNIFLREAWRYEMQDADAPLNINGTVYNEMKGSLGNITTEAYINTLSTLYPDSYQSTISGGDPEKIKDLTYEQIIETHKTYYHPSNSLMILYGNVDYTRFLELINEEYLSKYDKKEINIDYKKVEAFDEKVEKTYKFAVAADSETENSAQIDYAFALTDVNEEDILGVSIIASILSEDSSTLKKAFNDKRIGGNFIVNVNTSIMQPVITFTATNADEKKAGEFKALVDEYMSQLQKNGFDKELIDATISSSLLSFANMTEQSSLGVNLSSGISVMWANTGEFTYYHNLIKNMKNISGKVDNNYFEDLTEKYILNNNHGALVTTVPEAGLTEKLAEQQQKYLTDLKASMGVEEIEKIVNDTKSYNEWNSRVDSEEDLTVIKELQVVTAAELPVEVKTYEINEIKGASEERIISAKADVSETGVTILALDTSGMPVEKLHLLKFYSTLLGRLDTGKYSKEQLNALTTRYLNGTGFSMSTLPQKDSDEFIPILTTSWMGLMGEYNEQLALVNEILLNTDFSDTDTVLNIIRSQIADMNTLFTANPINILVSRNLALTSDSSNYGNYISGLEYFDFLVQLEQVMQTDPEAVVAEIEAVHKLVLNKTNMIAAFAGNDNGIKVFNDNINTLIDALPANEIIPQDYSVLPKPSQREGVSMDTQVQYNMLSVAFDKIGFEYNGKYIPIASMVNDIYLTPILRHGNGVYSILSEFNDTSFLVLTYRDPNIRETFAVYGELAEFVKNVEITQEELDRYILNAYSTYTASTGELTGALNYIGEYLMGRTSEDKLKLLEEIKSVTVQDVRESAAFFESVIENGAYTTVGSAAKIDENKDLYESIIAFGQKKGPEEPITTVQFIELMLQGVPNAMEVAKQQGLLVGDGQGNYFEDEPLTKERLAVFLNRIATMNGVQLSGGDVVIFDVDSISPWAKSSVTALVGTGVMKLDADGSFSPKGTVTASDVMDAMNELVVALTRQ